MIKKIGLIMSIGLLLTGCSESDIEEEVLEDMKVVEPRVITEYTDTEEVTNFVKIDIENEESIIIELYPDIAPITVENFQNLVKEDFYDGLIFHRVISGFMIQGGDPSGDGTGGSPDEIKGEFQINDVNNTLSHTRGVISMARRGGNPETEETMNSASSQFFIVHEDSNFLDKNYAGFGQVLMGMETVDNIASVSVNSSDKPLNDVVIKTISFVNIEE